MYYRELRETAPGQDGFIAFSHCDDTVNEILIWSEISIVS